MLCCLIAPTLNDGVEKIIVANLATLEDDFEAIRRRASRLRTRQSGAPGSSGPIYSRASMPSERATQPDVSPPKDGDVDERARVDDVAEQCCQALPPIGLKRLHRRREAWIVGAAAGVNNRGAMPVFECDSCTN